MMHPVPQHLINATNEEVLDYLAPLSCHGDMVKLAYDYAKT